MPPASLEEFRATRRVVSVPEDSGDEEVITYWNNASVTLEELDREEVLHIARRKDGSSYLEIGNIVYSGELRNLEETLYQWALDEGWLG